MARKRDDRHFIGCLREIQRHYVHLPKDARLRVEAWVQKIAAAATTGSGSGSDAFALHRNRYASLLMHQCMKRTLTDPFDKQPPDGLLPAFPSHLRSKLRDVAHPDDAAFWSDIFDAVQNAVEGRGAGEEQAVAASVQPSAHAMEGSCAAEVADQGAEQMRKLQEIIQSQEHRIALLVRQMESDRAAFQLALQRQEQQHNAQVQRLENTLKEISRMSVTAKSSRGISDDALTAGEDSLFSVPLPQPRSVNNRYMNEPGISTPVRQPTTTLTQKVTRDMSNDEFMRYLSQFQRDLQSASSDPSSHRRSDKLDGKIRWPDWPSP